MARDGEHVGEAQKFAARMPARGERIEIRRADLAAEAAEIRVAQVIGDDQKNVLGGPLRRDLDALRWRWRWRAPKGNQHGNDDQDGVAHANSSRRSTQPVRRAAELGVAPISSTSFGLRTRRWAAARTRDRRGQIGGADGRIARPMWRRQRSVKRTSSGAFRIIDVESCLAP
jgi:hypothetical protein